MDKGADDFTEFYRCYIRANRMKGGDEWGKRESGKVLKVEVGSFLSPRNHPFRYCRWFSLQQYDNLVQGVRRTK
jgi:hypothetical protein